MFSHHRLKLLGGDSRPSVALWIGSRWPILINGPSYLGTVAARLHAVAFQSRNLHHRNRQLNEIHDMLSSSSAYPGTDFLWWSLAQVLSALSLSAFVYKHAPIRERRSRF